MRRTVLTRFSLARSPGNGRARRSQSVNGTDGSGSGIMGARWRRRIGRLLIPFLFIFCISKGKIRDDSLLVMTLQVPSSFRSCLQVQFGRRGVQARTLFSLSLGFSTQGAGDCVRRREEGREFKTPGVAPSTVLDNKNPRIYLLLTLVKPYDAHYRVRRAGVLPA